VRLRRVDWAGWDTGSAKTISIAQWSKWLEPDQGMSKENTV